MRSSKGFATMAALAILALCAGFAIFFLKMFTLGQETAASDAMAERAMQAAKAGSEIALYRSLISASCGPATPAVPGFTDFTIDMQCVSTTATEGGATVIFDQWTITACNAPTCPAVGLQAASYVERQLKVQVAR